MHRRNGPADTFLSLERAHQKTLKNLNCFSEILRNLRFEGRSQWSKNISRAGKLLLFFENKAVGHMRLEENALFPFLQSHIPRVQPLIDLLLSEHEDFRNSLKEMKQVFGCFKKKKADTVQTIHALNAKAAYFTCLLRSHLWAESQVLYSVASKELRPDEKKLLAKKMERRTT